MSQAVNAYFEQIQQKLAQLAAQQETLDRAARAMLDTVLKGRNLFVFGASHAGILAEEMSYRAGGLAIVNPLFSPALMLNVRPLTLTSAVENVEGLGKVMVESSPLEAGDTLIIHSVSGRNAITLDVALAAKACGATVIAITSLETAKRVTSRHSSGKLLAGTADITLDNQCDYGDAAVSLPGLAQKAAPLSTIMGATIANSLVLRLCELMQENGVEPPILASANIDGNQQINRDIMDAYRSRIFYL
ncbi:SIS domain-containing protein [Atlantibacter subterranea]|uniref:sugar isomerase domain-containing protein n=1 Tax=Atlantibacter subterraneus TaxID=255519 RepID=UPI0011836275|nr:SIS domain-containing protein [Atlantibacter subterranea]TSJ59775.1 SIS domain-containing protein [Atlantibacter subterranea]